MMNEVIRCYPTRIHELLELELNEKFKIKNYDGEYYLAASGLLYETQNHREPVKQQMITILINDPELIERKSRKAKLTNEQVDILKGLNALGFNYLIYIYEKEDSYTMYATVNAPSWKNGAWDLNGSKAVINLSVHCPAFVLICLMGLVTIYNKEPFFIRQALIDNGVGIEPCEICKWGKTSVERYIENLVTLDMRDFVDFNYCFNCGRKLEAEE